MSEIERKKEYHALKAERLTRNDIIQGNINMLDSGALECRRVGKLASAEEKEIIAEILTAELGREKNPLTMEGVVSEAYDRGYKLGYSDGYQDGTKGVII